MTTECRQLCICVAPSFLLLSVEPDVLRVEVSRPAFAWPDYWLRMRTPNLTDAGGAVVGHHGVDPSLCLFLRRERVAALCRRHERSHAALVDVGRDVSDH